MLVEKPIAPDLVCEERDCLVKEDHAFAVDPTAHVIGGELNAIAIDRLDGVNAEDVVGVHDAIAIHERRLILRDDFPAYP